MFAMLALGLGLLTPVMSPPTTSTTVALVSARSVDLWDALRFWAQRRNLSLVIDPSVPHRIVSYRIDGDTTVEDAAFGSIIAGNRLIIVRRGAITFVAPLALASAYGAAMATDTIETPGVKPSSLVSVYDGIVGEGVTLVPDEARRVIVIYGERASVARAKALIASAQKPLQTTIVRMRNGSDARTIAAILGTNSDATQGGTITPVTDVNGIALTGPVAWVTQTSGLIAALDVTPIPVRFKVTLWEVIPTDEEIHRGTTLGPIVAGRAASSSSSNGISTGLVPIAQISASLDALERKGSAEIVNEAVVTVNTGQQGIVNFPNSNPIPITDQVTGVVTVRTVDTGFKLELTPVASDAGSNTSIKLEYSVIRGTGVQQYPIIARRNTTTQVFIKKGDAIVLSALTTNASTISRELSPPFAYIPLIGSWFKHRDETHLRSRVYIVAQPLGENDEMLSPLSASTPAKAKL